MSIGFGLALALAAGGSGAADDDLAVVRKAVSAQAAPTAAAKDTEPQQQARPSPAARAAKPRWLRVRVTERGADKARVSVNLPIGLVEALGDEPLDLCHHRHRAAKCRVTLRELLASFEGGQRLVDVESEDGDVKVWVE